VVLWPEGASARRSPGLFRRSQPPIVLRWRGAASSRSGTEVSVTELEEGMEFVRALQNHRLEQTSKSIESNHPPNTTLGAKPHPEVPHLHVF